MANSFIIKPYEHPIGKSKVISARLPNTVVDKLDEVARQTGRSRNQIMLLCIEHALENLKIEEDAGEG